MSACPVSSYKLPQRLELAPYDQKRSGVEDRAVGAGDDADGEGEGESLERRTTREEDRGEDQDDGEARDDRPRRGLHDAQVHDLVEREPLAHPQVLADPVEDDDGVVDRKADNRQHGGDEEGIDLADAPGEDLAEDRKDA